MRCKRCFGYWFDMCEAPLLKRIKCFFHFTGFSEYEDFEVGEHK